MKKALLIVGGILAVVVVSGASFWAGMAYQTKRVDQARATFFNTRGGQIPEDGQFSNPAQGQGFLRGGGSIGQMKSIEGNVLTLSTAQEVTTVNLSDETTVVKSVKGSLSDLQPGVRVMVNGERDSKGNLAASQITILNEDYPLMRTAP